MRTIWHGSITFGLVNIPAELALATQRSEVSFRTLHRECGTPLRAGRYCPGCERHVEPDALTLGWEVAKGQFVLVEGEDLESIALPRSQSIEVTGFVRLDQVDPVYFDRTYYLAPGEARASRRSYVLLLRAMQATGMAALGRFVLWGKENLCLIRPHGDALALETLFFAEDVRSRVEIEQAVAETDVPADELELAQAVIESLAGDFDPSALESEYRQELRLLLEAKLSGEVLSPDPVSDAPVVDLLEALRHSVAATRKQQSSKKSAVARHKTAPDKKGGKDAGGRQASEGRKRARKPSIQAAEAALTDSGKVIHPVSEDAR